MSGWGSDKANQWKDYHYRVRRKIAVCKMRSFSQVYKLSFHMWISWIWGNGCSRGAFRMLNCRAFCISLKMKWVFCTKLNRGGCPLPWSPGVAPSAGRCHCQPAAAPRGEYFSNDTLISKKLMEPPHHDFLLALSATFSLLCLLGFHAIVCQTYKHKIPCNDDRSVPSQIMIFLIKRGEYARNLETFFWEPCSCH